MSPGKVFGRFKPRPRPRHNTQMPDRPVSCSGPAVAEETDVAAKQGHIYAGIGGWTFAPWRGVFYPKGLPHAQELRFAAQHLTSIEVNGTFYRTQSPASYRKWASEVPDGFVFSLKGPRFAVNRRVLAEAGDFDQALPAFGLARTGRQARSSALAIRADQEIRRGRFREISRTAAARFDGRPLRHVVEVRHDSFRVPAFVDAAAAIPHSRSCFAEHATYPAIADLTGDFVYARLQKGQEKLKAGYPPKALDEWAARARHGPKAARRPTCPVSFQDPAKKAAARRLLFILFTRPRCAPLPPPWR